MKAPTHHSSEHVCQLTGLHARLQLPKHPYIPPVFCPSLHPANSYTCNHSPPRSFIYSLIHPQIHSHIHPRSSLPPFIHHPLVLHPPCTCPSSHLPTHPVIHTCSHARIWTCLPLTHPSIHSSTLQSVGNSREKHKGGKHTILSLKTLESGRALCPRIPYLWILES